VIAVNGKVVKEMSANSEVRMLGARLIREWKRVSKTSQPILEDLDLDRLSKLQNVARRILNAEISVAPRFSRDGLANRRSATLQLAVQIIKLVSKDMEASWSVQVVRLLEEMNRNSIALDNGVSFFLHFGRQVETKFFRIIRDRTPQVRNRNLWSDARKCGHCRIRSEPAS
jgi:hypothetical protein